LQALFLTINTIVIALGPTVSFPFHMNRTLIQRLYVILSSRAVTSTAT